MDSKPKGSQAAYAMVQSVEVLIPDNWYSRWGKRMFDIIGAVILLAITFWLFPICALFTWLGSPGTIMFNQPRVGLSGKVFTIFKFRTLYWTNAIGPDGQVRQTNQHRTVAGRLMRRFRIDELPQLLNVLRGEMSLIGPRPILVDEYIQCARFDPRFGHRVRILGGITGLSQVRIGRPEGEEMMKRRYLTDLEYLQNLSFWNDFKIALVTPWVVISGFGAL